MYTRDLFHTLVNIPLRRFLMIFMSVFMLEFVLFALVYYLCSQLRLGASCIPGIRGFPSALYFSFQTGLTLTFGGLMTPDPACGAVQCIVAVQALASKVIEYTMLGISFCRFTSPESRRHGLFIASRLVLEATGGEDNRMLLSVRVANVRKHQLLNAKIKIMFAYNHMMMPADADADADAHADAQRHPSPYQEPSAAAGPARGAPDGVVDGADEGYVIRELETRTTNDPSCLLWLPCICTHVVDARSPLYGINLEEDRHRYEFMVVVEGSVVATSHTCQSCRSFTYDDIALDCRYASMVTRDTAGRTAVDFSRMNDVVFLEGSWSHSHYSRERRGAAASVSPGSSPALPKSPAL